MALFDDVKAIVLSSAPKAEKIQKLRDDVKCTRFEAERLYSMIVYTHGDRSRTATGETHRQTRFTIGIEIECYGVDKSAAGNALAQKGIKSIATGYTHEDSKDTYKLAHDGSISGNNPCEVVTPILRSLDTLKVVCKTINELGAQVNRSCGLHVHFGAQKFTIEQWVRILTNYANIEPIIDSFMAESRRGNNNGFCKTIIGKVERLKMNQRAGEINSMQAIQYCFNHDRYHKVNVMAYNSHKTIEFRQHQGTTDFDKIEQWVGFLTALLNWSLTHTEVIEANSIDDLPFLTAKQKRFFNARKAQFNR